MKLSPWSLLPILAVPLFFSEPASAQSPEEFFETRVRPVLAASCFECHGRLRRGNLRLNSREAMLRGGDSGPAIIPEIPREAC